MLGFDAPEFCRLLALITESEICGLFFLSGYHCIHKQRFGGRGAFMRKLRLWLVRLAFVPVIAVAVFVRPNWPEGELTAFICEFAGYLLLLAGLAIRLWSIAYIGGKKSRHVIDQGPYSLCRNPLYVGTFLLTVGVGLCFENLIMLALCVMIIVPAHLAVVRMEENHLEKLFGEDYRQYRQKVPRYLPRLRNYQSPPYIEVSVKAIRRMVIDASAVLMIPAVEDLLEMLHDHGIIPILYYFPK